MTCVTTDPNFFSFPLTFVQMMDNLKKTVNKALLGMLRPNERLKGALQCFFYKTNINLNVESISNKKVIKIRAFENRSGIQRVRCHVQKEEEMLLYKLKED